MTSKITTDENTAREAALPRVTPAVILEAAEDPTVFAPLFRGMGMHNAFKMGEMMKNPNVSLRDRMEWQRMCMDYGQVPKTVAVQQGEQLPSITIVLPGHPDRNVQLNIPHAEVIDVEKSD